MARSIEVLQYSQKSLSFVNKIPRQFAAKQNSFYQDVRPVLLMMRVCSVYFLTMRQNKGSCSSDSSSLVSAYSLLVQIPMWYMTGIMLMERINDIMLQNATFSEHLVDGAVLVVHLPVIVIPVTHWMEITKMVNYVNSWAVFEADFQRVTRRQLDINLRKSVKRIVACLVPLVLLLEVEAFVVPRGLNCWWHGIPFGFSIVVCAMLPSNWTMVCTGIMVVARTLAEDLETCFTKLRFNPGDNLSEYRKLWLKLSNQVQDFGECCGFTYGCQTIIFFMIQIITSYACLSELGRGPFVISLVFGTGTLVFTGLIHVQCNAAHFTTNEVGPNFEEKLEYMAIKFPTGNKTMKYDIRFFLETITLNPPVISYCGFTDVNRGLLSSLIAATVTYLVVLTQFQMSHVTTADKPATNATAY